MQKIRKLVLYGALLVWAAAIGLRAILELIYFDYPKQPDAATARTVPYVVKNVIVYITANESKLLYWLQWCFYAFGLVVVINVILDQIWPPRQNK